MNAVNFVDSFNRTLSVHSNQVAPERQSHEKPGNKIHPGDVSDPVDAKKVVDELNRLSGSFNEKVQFSFHEKTNRIIVKVIDKNTNEVIREIPSRYSMKLLEHLQEYMGLFIDESR